MEFSDAFNEVMIELDNNKTQVSFGTKVRVKESFLVPKISGVRVNVIGFDYSKDESDVLISKKNMQKPYSLDLAGKIYRVEFYELRWANFQQLLEQNTNSKLIKNAKSLDISTMKTAKMKDKFIGSFLVEFE